MEQAYRGMVSGARVYQLTILEPPCKKLVGKGVKMAYVVKVKCACGNIRDMRAYQLSRGITTNCGCGSSATRFSYEGVGDLSLAYFNSFKRTRGNKGIAFDEAITIEYLWELFLKQNAQCALSGIAIHLNRKWSAQSKRNHLVEEGRASLQTASVDRIDNERGYTPGNIQWVHKDVNYMKGGLTQDAFIFLARKIAEKSIGADISEQCFTGARQYFGGRTTKSPKRSTGI